MTQTNKPAKKLASPDRVRISATIPPDILEAAITLVDKVSAEADCSLNLSSLIAMLFEIVVDSQDHLVLTEVTTKLELRKRIEVALIARILQKK